MKEKFQEALDLIDQDGKLKKTVWGQFWSSHQRFFKYLCMACKVPYVVDLAKKALSSNKCVVIGLQSTGEARTLEQIDECGEINEFVSTARGVLQNLVEKHFPTIENTSSPNSKTSNNRSKETKNSQKVNDIFHRLSSYTNNSAGRSSSPKKKCVKKNIKNRSSSISSNSSVSSSIGSMNSSKMSLNDLNDENDELFESDFGDEDDLDSDFSLSSLDDLLCNNTKSKNNNLDNFDLNIKGDQNDSGISLNSTKASSQASTKNTGFESEDSDSLFSITKSVSVQALINKNNQENRKKPSLSSEERKKRLRDKKRKKMQQLNIYENEDDEDEDMLEEQNQNLVESSEPINLNKIESESDDDFKLPAKRLKNEFEEEVKNELDLDDPFGFSVSTSSSYVPKKRAKPTSAHQISEYIFEMKSDLLNAIRHLGRRLPANTLDELIDLLDGPHKVAEMTGRKGRIVSRTNQSNNNENDTNQNGNFVYETRNESDVPLELMNIVQKERFMNGEKLIAIISEAASSGISLQANRRYANQCRRVHITIELPWSADRAIQQFGRTHRSNQVSAPEYIFVISQLAGEKRFASTVAKRLESLVSFIIKKKDWRSLKMKIFLYF